MPGDAVCSQCSTRPAEFRRAVLAGSVTVLVGKCAELGFSIIESQDIAFFFNSIGNTGLFISFFLSSFLLLT